MTFSLPGRRGLCDFRRFCAFLRRLAHYERFPIVLDSSSSRGFILPYDPYDGRRGISTQRDSFGHHSRKANSYSSKEIYQPNNLVWIVVGDRTKIEEKIKQLDIGEVIPINDLGNPIK